MPTFEPLDKLAFLYREAQRTGGVESIRVANKDIFELACEWNGGVPFLTCTVNGQCEPISAQAALELIESAP